MGYREVEWTKYGKNADIVEFTIRDPTKKKIDFLRASTNKDFKTCLGILRKYGFDTRKDIPKKEKIDEEREEFKKEKDFLEPDLKW